MSIRLKASLLALTLTFCAISVSACAASTQMDGSTVCSTYSSQPQGPRQLVAEQVSVRNHVADAGSPMQYLNADEYCARNPGATVSDAVGKSDQLRRQEYLQSSSAAAPPSVSKVEDADGTTHLLHVCLPGQKSTNIVVDGMPVDHTLRLTLNGKVIATPTIADQTSSDNTVISKLVPVPCVNGEKLVANSGVATFWSATPGQMLKSTDTTNPSGPATVSIGSHDADPSDVVVVLDN